MLLTLQEIQELVTKTVEERLGRTADDAEWGPLLDRLKVSFAESLPRHSLGRFVGLVEADGRRTMELRFHAGLWSGLTEEGRRDTVIHELAHAVDFHHRGRTAHDSVWRQVAVRLGCTPRAVAPASQLTSELLERLRALRRRRGYRCFDCALCGWRMRLTRANRKSVAAGGRLRCSAATCGATLPENVFELSYIQKRE